MQEHIVIKAKVLKNEVFTTQEHELGCRFICKGVPVLSTSLAEFNMQIIEFTAVYTGELTTHYLTYVVPEQEYIFSGEKLEREHGTWELLIKNIAK